MSDPAPRLCAVALAVAGVGACHQAEIVEGFPDSFVGVGLELTMKGDAPIVVRAIDGGPASVAGVRPGDRIVEVDGKATAGKTLGDVVMSLRGASGSQVTLGLDRGGTRVLVVVRRSKLKKESSDYKAEK